MTSQTPVSDPAPPPPDDEISSMPIAVVPPASRVAGALREAGFGNVSSFEPHTPPPQVDLVIVDVAAPELGATMRSLSALAAPALVVASEATSRRSAVAAGATELLSDPSDPVEVGVRVRTMLAAVAVERSRGDAEVLLEARVRERTEELELARHEVLDKLVRAAEYRDNDTRDHTRRVGDTSALLADAIGLDAETVTTIRLAAPLHDIGKIGVPDSILLKPGRLDDREFDAIRMHPVIGGRILWGSHSAVLKSAQEIALFHHERWDGRGYPAEFAGHDIPLSARIVGIADVFDALTHARPYKFAWPIGRAVEEIRALSGSHLDPELAPVFADLIAGGALETIPWA